MDSSQQQQQQRRGVGASNQRDDRDLNPSSPAAAQQQQAEEEEQQDRMVAQFLAHFDPLARLEAEYAAVLAQSTAEKADDPTDNQLPQGDSEDENEDEYARLPMSPGADDGDDEDAAGGEYYQPLGDASDSESDDGDRDDTAAEELQGNGLPVKAPTAVAPMDAATRETIMKSMQGMQLAPPPWAKDAKLSDDELFAMVRDRLERY